MTDVCLDQDAIQRAAEAIHNADGLLIGAGAGMGVDSGLPDFRGDAGFWKAYPPFAKRNLSFVDMANPQWFDRDPALAWGFYGHRMHLYRATVPHRGFSILRGWGEQMSAGAFVFTSNVDGQFQEAGFSDQQVVECHGSIHHLQCTAPCSDAIWSAQDEQVDIDEVTFNAQQPLPKCRCCGLLARPNILMFGDGGWLSWRADVQTQKYMHWQEQLDGKSLVAIECGAGTAIPSVRWACQRATEGADGTLIRINPREPQIDDGISFAAGALEVLEAINDVLRSDSGR